MILVGAVCRGLPPEFCNVVAAMSSTRNSILVSWQKAFLAYGSMIPLNSWKQNSSGIAALIVLWPVTWGQVSCEKLLKKYKARSSPHANDVSCINTNRNKTVSSRRVCSTMVTLGPNWWHLDICSSLKNNFIFNPNLCYSSV